MGLFKYTVSGPGEIQGFEVLVAVQLGQHADVVGIALVGVLDEAALVSPQGSDEGAQEGGRDERLGVIGLAVPGDAGG